MHYHGGRFKVKKNPRTVNGSEQPALPWGAYSFYMESIIFKNTSYINRVTGSIQWDERKLKIYMSKIFVAVFFSHQVVWLFTTPWTAACQACLPLTISWSFLKFMSIESVMSSNYLILSPCSFPASASFPMSQLFASDAQSIGTSASVLPKSIQCWFPLRLTGLISLLSKGCSRVKQRTSN